MPYDKKLNQAQIAETNKYNVFRCLLREGPINRAAIAKRVDLSIPTVMIIVDDLFEKKMIKSAGKGETGVGKQPEILAIDPGRCFYVGVDIGRSAIRMVANNAVGAEIASMKEPTGDPFPEKQFIGYVQKRTLQFIRKLMKKNGEALGAGFAMPALMEPGKGRVITAPDFGWRDIPLQDWLQKGLPCPVLVKNSTQALAVNETGSTQDENHTTLCVNLGYGIGAAIISGGKLYDGQGGISGELGHCVVDRDGPLCKCGNSGCLEAVASGEAIARQARMVIVHHARSKISELCGGDTSLIDAKMVFDAARAGDSLSVKIVNSAARYIGMALSFAVNILDPDQVILCGGLARNGDGFLGKIKSAMEDHLVAKENRTLTLSAGAFDEYSTAKGAAQALFDTLWFSRKLPI
jgi:predicted NBD/HSP70 family sugar kinase